MSAIAVVATITAAEGQADDVARALADAAAAVKANEPGCQFYRIARSRDDANVFKVLELYDDKAAIEAHGGSDHFKALGQALRGKLAGAPTVERLDVVA